MTLAYISLNLMELFRKVMDYGALYIMNLCIEFKRTCKWKLYIQI